MRIVRVHEPVLQWDAMSDLPENGEHPAHAILSAFSGVLWVCPASTLRVRLYGAVEALTGYTMDEFQSQPSLWTALIHPDDRLRLEQQRQSGAESSWYWRLVRADGKVLWVQEILLPLNDPGMNATMQQGLIVRAHPLSRQTHEEPGLPSHGVAAMLRASGFLALGDPHDTPRMWGDEPRDGGSLAFDAEPAALLSDVLLLRTIFDRVPTGMVVILGETLLANSAVERMTGYRVDECSTLDRWFHLLFPGRGDAVRAMHEEDRRAGYPDRRLLRVTHRNGALRHIEFQGLQTDHALVWFLTDLTERVRSEQQRAANSSQVSAMLEAIPDLILALDDNGIALQVKLTEQHRTLFGEQDQALVGRPVLDLFSPSRALRGRTIIRQVISTGEMAFVEFSLVPPDQALRFFEARVSRLDEASVLAVVRDVTEQHHIRRQLNQLAFEDPLTGLPNRRSFAFQLQQCMDACVGSGNATVTVLFVDLDHFKAVNDSFGHRCGDEVLVAIAGRIRGAIHELDVPTRYAGDEFLILLQHEASRARATELAERVREAVSQPVPWNGQMVYVTASVGVVNYHANPGTASDCLAEADAAMYRAKSVGRNTVVVFDAQMRQEVARGLRLESELRLAMTNDEIQLFYQPVCDAITAEIVSFEALARWHHPADGIRSAGAFIPLAEERGMIVPLGYRLIQLACRDIARAGQTSPALCQIPIQVNISYHQLAMPGFVGQVRDLVQHYEIPPGRLRFEMTETALITDVALAQRLLHQLLDIGISTVMDDFGVGYSSLSYLLQYPLKGVKVDRSFVMKIGRDPKTSLILQTIQQLGDGLGLPVVAEGVETREQLRHLVSLGYQNVQGFLYSEAIPWSEIERKYASDPRIPVPND